MSPHRGRFVTASQQLLALAAVFVALVPATRVVSLDVVAVQPRSGHAQTVAAVPARLPGRAHGAWSRLVRHPLAHRDLVAPLW